ncbi:MAG: NAD(P)/FAD-dependent oxidoreductase [Planctomycetes bacterium]|nr:NAD(P)/FAD-dependent oxidoreductase [Planctomycetota bacterium]
MKYDAIIIGAGMSGLAAGIRLAMFDKRVVVLEKHYVWGGLNSFYQFKGRQFDVGLHAMTNYIPRGAKGRPLTRLLKQLRLRHEDLDLHEQNYSLISFPSAKLRFTNDFSVLRDEVRREFPAQRDAFDNLTRAIADFNELDLSAPRQSAREVVRRFVTEPLLEDMLFCPLTFYGSAIEHDMDWDQFVVMWKSIYMEGFARPTKGVRHVLTLLTNRYRELGGELRLRAGVKRIVSRTGEAVGVELENSEVLEADCVLSSAGFVESMKLLEPTASAVGCMPMRTGNPTADAVGLNGHIGRLSFTESISVLNPGAMPTDATIIFFSNRDRFEYRCPDELVDVDSGVICMPQNFRLDEPIAPMVRVTNIANHAKWCALRRDDGVDSSVNVPADWGQGLGARDQGSGSNPQSPIPNPLGNDAYTAAKQACYERSINAITPRHLADFRPQVSMIDMFTPRTIEHYTGHLGGAVYGSPVKRRTGETPVKNLYVMGTDQGFLGIIGAALSGISMANKWVLQRDGVLTERDA